jgi:GNAT superfamily N-acetyltransferase
VIQFHLVKNDDNAIIELVSDWYLREWNIPKNKTIEKIRSFVDDKFQFQVLMTIDDIPVSTGGLYNHVALLDKEPRFSVYKNWLALVYTIPEKRRHGFGAFICNYIQEHSKELRIKEMHLFTDTAERLYTRLGWSKLEQIALGVRNITVMTKQL